MKKFLAIFLALAVFSCSACGKAPEPETVPPATETLPVTEPETLPAVYTYQVEAMQNADCAYYPPDASVPNSSGTAQGKIVVWSQCPQCFEENIGTHHIDPRELDFSAGDSVMYSGSDSSWDCSWDYDMDQFMWTIRVTRIPK